MEEYVGKDNKSTYVIITSVHYFFVHLLGRVPVLVVEIRPIIQYTPLNQLSF